MVTGKLVPHMRWSWNLRRTETIVTVKFRGFGLKKKYLPTHAILSLSQPAITCSKLTIETPEQRCEICSKLKIKPPKRCRRFGGFIVNFQHDSQLCSKVSIVNFEQVNVDGDAEVNATNHKAWKNKSGEKAVLADRTKVITMIK